MSSRDVQELFGSDPEDEDGDAESAFQLSLATASPGPGEDGSFDNTPAASGGESGAIDEDESDEMASIAGRKPASSFALSLDDVGSLESDDDDDDEVESNKAEGKHDASVTAADLFGDADDISSSGDSDFDGGKEQEKSKASGPAPSRRSQPVDDDDEDADGGRGFMIDDLDDDEEQELEEPRMSTLESELPVFPSMMGEQLSFVKLPNFLSVEPRAFDPDVYEEEVDEDDLLDEEGRARLKLKIENTMRWRYGKDPKTGIERRESNARIVKWSDGSASLLLGSEVFDIHQTQLVRGDFSHLFVQQGTGLQGQAVFRTKLTFRPHSTDSHTHRKMTMSIADRFGKAQKIRILPVAGKDPESHRSEMMRKEDERFRSAVRLENRQRRQRERSHAHGRLSRSFLEHRDDDDEGLDMIKRSFASSSRRNVVKKKPAVKTKSSAVVSSDEGAEDDDDDEEEDDDDDDDDEDDEEEDEEDEEDDGFIDDTVEGNESDEAPPSPPTESRKRSRRDSDAGQSKKKKKARSKMVISSDEESD